MAQEQGQTENFDLDVNEPLISLGEGSLDRMPTLHLLFEDAATRFSRDFCAMTGAKAVLIFERLEAKRLTDLIKTEAGFAYVGVYDTQDLGCRSAVGVDSRFSDFAVEMLLGSGVIDPPPQTPRPLSRLVKRLTDLAIAKILEGVAGAFAPLADIAFEICEQQAEAGFAALGQRTGVALVATFRLCAFDQECAVVFAAPRAAFEPHRAALARLPGAEGFARDLRWAEDLYDHVVQTEVKVDVRIDARGFTLSDIASLEVGDLVRLPIAPDSPIRVESEGRALFWCTLGQKDGYFTIRLEEVSDDRRSFIENVLGM
jgi:flagellar motor switch protein FliM